MPALLPLRLRLHVVAVVNHDPVSLDRLDVVVVRMLVKRQQHVGVIPGAQHLARTNPHLEDRWAAGNSRRNGHERHDLLFAAPGQPGQKTANGLNAILRIARNADDDLGYTGDRRLAGGGLLDGQS